MRVGLLNEQTKLQERARLVRVLTCSTSCAQELCGRLEVVNAFAGCFDCGGKRYLDEQFQIPRIQPQHIRLVNTATTFIR